MVRDSVCAMRGLAGATVIESTELICEVKFDAQREVSARSFSVHNNTAVTCCTVDCGRSYAFRES